MMHSVYFPGFFLSIRHTMINICPASDLKNLFEYKKPMELILKLPKVMDGSTHMRRLSLGWFCCPSKTTSVFHPVDPEMSLVLDFVNDLLDFVLSMCSGGEISETSGILCHASSAWNEHQDRHTVGEESERRCDGVSADQPSFGLPHL